jgi:hypothetical protein
VGIFDWLFEGVVCGAGRVVLFPQIRRLAPLTHRFVISGKPRRWMPQVPKRFDGIRQLFDPYTNVLLPPTGSSLHVLLRTG